MNERVLKSADLVVVGGGLAGVCAALAAARQGCRVILCHERPLPGGNSGSEIRVWACGATGTGNNRHADETGIINELILENLYRNSEGNPHLWDHLLLETLTREPNIDLLLNTCAHAAVMENNKLRSVLCRQMSTGRDFTLLAPLFIDCTGDAALASLAGAACIHGVSDSPLGRTNRGSLGSSLLFYTKRCDTKVRYIPPAFAIPREEIARLLSETGKTLRIEHDGCDRWWIEYGGELDTIRDSEDIAFMLRRIVFGVWDYIKNSGTFDADFLTLEWVGSLPGRRESLRAVSRHMLTAKEILAQTSQPDAVCHGGWPIDTHPPAGFFDKRASCTQVPVGVYDIPLGALLCRDVNNLLLAGRDAGMTHEAMASARVMKTCAAMGQAAGTAAALCLKQDVLPKDLAGEQLAAIRRQLLRDDLWIIGLKNEDPLDLARRGLVRGTPGIALDFPAEYAIRLEEGCCILLPPLLLGGEISIPIASISPVTLTLFASNAPQNYLPVHQLNQKAFPALPAMTGCVISAPPNANNLIVRVESADSFQIGTRRLPVPGVLGIPGLTARGLRGIFTPAIRVSPDPDLFAPVQVINGYNRPYGGMNCWAARFDQGAELKITLSQPSVIRLVELYLDCGLYRDYNNLRPDYYNEGWAYLHENLLRDFTLELICEEETRRIDIRENHQRHVRVGIKAGAPIHAVKVRCHRSWGGDIAVIHEVRLY